MSSFCPFSNDFLKCGCDNHTDKIGPVIMNSLCYQLYIFPHLFYLNIFYCFIDKVFRKLGQIIFTIFALSAGFPVFKLSILENTGNQNPLQILTFKNIGHHIRHHLMCDKVAEWRSG